MAKRNPIQVHDLTFNNQNEAMSWFKELLSRSSNRTRIGSPDHERLLCLLRRHPEAERKIGVGVKYFYAGPAGDGGYGSRCFFLVRHDESNTDFSYRTCVMIKGKTLWDEFRNAARFLMEERLLDWKRTWFLSQGTEIIPCPETGEPMTFLTSHADHKPPWTFDRICQAFLNERGFVPSYSWISPPSDNQFRSRITDDSIKDDFIRFHDERADLQVISAAQNSLHGNRLKLRKNIPTVNEIRPEKMSEERYLLWKSWKNDLGQCTGTTLTGERCKIEITKNYYMDPKDFVPGIHDRCEYHQLAFEHRTVRDEKI